jgi:hypothetical protein
MSPWLRLLGTCSGYASTGLIDWLPACCAVLQHVVQRCTVLRKQLGTFGENSLTEVVPIPLPPAPPYLSLLCTTSSSFTKPLPQLCAARPVKSFWSQHSRRSTPEQLYLSPSPGADVGWGAPSPGAHVGRCESGPAADVPG